ncbi:MAG: cytidylate kinase-like family protein [Oscillospiraceae bacterium]|nr:MAG: cytidylate kinase-like family protein [Oscillospiraceae bacterium]
MSEQQFVITIARGYGSGGRTIGKMLAAELGIHFYDRKLLRLASDDSGINESLFGLADETPSLKMLLPIARRERGGEVIPPDRDDFISNENLFRYQAKVITELAKRESCVVIGRCADYVLRDFPNVLRVFIHAPLDFCAGRIAELNDLSFEAAKKVVQVTDKRRAAYYSYFTGSAWTNAENYDLCLDSSALGDERCVRLIREYLRIRIS